MGYRDGFGMGAQFHVEDGDIGTWLEGDLIARAVLAPLVDSGVLEEFRWLSGGDTPATPLASVAAILELSASWCDGTVELTTEPDNGPEDEPDGALILNPNGGGIQIGLRLGGTLLARRRATLLDDYGRWVHAWSRGLGAKVRLREGGLSPYVAPFPRARPPRWNERWSTGMLVHQLGIAYRRDQDIDEAAMFERLFVDPLPKGASRSVEGDVLTLRFIDRLDDDDAMAQARSRHAAWVLERVGGELERGWNEEGDQLVTAMGPPHAAITMYDRHRKVGYQAIVVQPDGSVDDEVWDAALALQRAGKLPGGEPLTAVRLFVPRREDALAIYDRAVAAGFDRVLFGRDQGLWDPRAPMD